MSKVRTLILAPSGAGKTTRIQELRLQGKTALDWDEHVEDKIGWDNVNYKLPSGIKILQNLFINMLKSLVVGGLDSDIIFANIGMSPAIINIINCLILMGRLVVKVFIPKVMQLKNQFFKRINDGTTSTVTWNETVSNLKQLTEYVDKESDTVQKITTLSAT